MMMGPSTVTYVSGLWDVPLSSEPHPRLVASQARRGRGLNRARTPAVTLIGTHRHSVQSFGLRGDDGSVFSLFVCNGVQGCADTSSDPGVRYVGSGENTLNADIVLSGEPFDVGNVIGVSLDESGKISFWVGTQPKSEDVPNPLMQWVFDAPARAQVGTTYVRMSPVCGRPACPILTFPLAGLRTPFQLRSLSSRRSA